MKLAPWIDIIEVMGELAGHRLQPINPVLFNDGKRIMLVDTGMPWHFSGLKARLASLGVHPDALGSILLTHQDIDHISNAHDLREMSGARVKAHPDDVPFIQGEQPLIKLTAAFMERVLPMMPEAAREPARAVFSNPSSVVVDQPLNDGEVIPIGSGVQVIHTPGHTPGHISLYVPSEALLIAGDALRVENGQLIGPGKQRTLDIAQAMASVRKLAALKIDKILCYHGGLFGRDAGQRLREIAG